MKEIQTKRTPRFRRWCRKGYAAFASLRRQVTIGVLSVSMSTILLSTTTPVQAQTVDSLTIARELEIEKVEVTGVKATPTRSTMSSTSVFDRKAGASAPVQTLESVLRLSPAIDLRERSGRGTQADIMIRGGSFDQTMVMLNGINFTDARTGHQSHSLPIDIDCIAGIDLIDGVSGVGAYAGALNIRTMPLKSRLSAHRGGGRRRRLCVRQSLGGRDQGTFFPFCRRVVPSQRRVYPQHRFRELQRLLADELRQ